MASFLAVTLNTLAAIADVAAIITALVAATAYGKYLCERRQQRRRLERYLERERETGSDEGKRTILHLVAQLGIPEPKIVDASFRSKVIKRYVSPDMLGHASVLLLRYEP